MRHFDAPAITARAALEPAQTPEVIHLDSPYTDFRLGPITLFTKLTLNGLDKSHGCLWRQCGRAHPVECLRTSTDLPVLLQIDDSGHTFGLCHIRIPRVESENRERPVNAGVCSSFEGHYLEGYVRP